jgi:hypothetical protein
MIDVNLQLEALREAKGWSTWVVGLGSAALAFLAFLKRSGVKQETARDSRALLLAASAGFVCAVTLVATVPSMIDQLPIRPPPQRILWFSVEGVYAYRVLDVIPLWTLYVGLYLALTIAALFALSITWRQLFGASFLDPGKRIAASVSVNDFNAVARGVFGGQNRLESALLPGHAILCFRSFEASDQAGGGTIRMMLVLPSVAPRPTVARWLIQEFASSTSEFRLGGNIIPLVEGALVNALR